MITIFDDQKELVTVRAPDGSETSYPFATPEAFEAISNAWLRVGWDTKHVYSFSWFGRPIIQLPDDMVRLQEVIYEHKPDVIIETGVAHGGSLVFYASLFKAMGKGRCIGVEIELRPHNRKAIEEHELKEYITIVDGSSIADETVEKVKNLIKPGEKVMVILDSNHKKPHVLEELRKYSPLVTPGCYIIACDGIMELVAGGPRTAPDWAESNPKAAALAFVEENKDFAIVEPEWPFNEGVLKERVTYWPKAYVKRLR